MPLFAAESTKPQKTNNKILTNSLLRPVSLSVCYSWIQPLWYRSVSITPVFFKECMTSMQWNLSKLVRWLAALTCRATGYFLSLFFLLPFRLRNRCFWFPLSFTTSPQGHFQRQTTPLGLQQSLFTMMKLMACMGKKMEPIGAIAVAISPLSKGIRKCVIKHGQRCETLWVYFFK